MVINQGDIYWAQAADSAIPHPYVIVQEDLFNHSRINTVVAVAVTSNLRRISLPGNVLLEAGEANLPKPSVVEVSKIVTLEKTALGQYIGTLSESRVTQILSGIRFLQSSFLPEE
jgi:mRNA interferase MazF